MTRGKSNNAHTSLLTGHEDGLVLSDIDGSLSAIPNDLIMAKCSVWATRMHTNAHLLGSC